MNPLWSNGVKMLIANTFVVCKSSLSVRPVPLQNWYTFAIALKKGIELIFQGSIRVNTEEEDDDHHDTAFIDSTFQEKNITIRHPFCHGAYFWRTIFS